eukprot:Tbor_TRINITY_DN5261_c5_g1::TRINITY_DN5261_c5_g1_i1::g.16173::m.16173
MYTLLVCADLYGSKVNLEITFSHMPTISELHKRIILIFTTESAVRRPPGYPSTDFNICKLQIYDDILLRWTDLVSCQQLHEYDQIYAFQAQSPWHVDTQRDLPPPRPPTQLINNNNFNYHGSSIGNSVNGNDSIINNNNNLI